MKYEKLIESAQGGQFYEIKLAMLVLLRACAAYRRGEIDHFFLATNLKAAHPFDDVVLKYSKGESSRIMLIQAKSKKKGAVKWETLISPSNKGDFCVRWYLNGQLSIDLDAEEPLRGPYERRELLLYTNAKLESKNKCLVPTEANEILRIADKEMFKIHYDDSVYDKLKIPTDFTALVEELAKCVQTCVYQPEIEIFRRYREHLQQSVIDFGEDSKVGLLFKADFLSGSATMADEIRTLRQALLEKLKSKQEDEAHVQDKLSRVQVHIKKGHAGTQTVEPISDLRTQLEKHEVRNFLDDFYIAAGQLEEKELEELMKQEISRVYEVNASDSDAIYSDVFTKMQKWWKDSDEYLTENDDLFKKFRMKLTTDSAKKQYINTRLVYKSEEEKLFDDSNRLVYVRCSDDEQLLSCVKVCQTLEKSKAKYMILNQNFISENLEDVLDAFNNDYDILAIVGDEPVSVDISQILIRKEHKRLVLIGSGVRCVAPSTTILQVGFDQLTEESQGLIMKHPMRLHGRDFLLSDVFRPELRNLISDELLSRIEGGHQIEIGRPTHDLTSSVPRTLSLESTSGAITRHDAEGLSSESKFILVSGEAGVGKSQLISSLRADSFMWKYRINLAYTFEILKDKNITILPFLQKACAMEEVEFALFKQYYESFGGIVLFFDGFDEISPDDKDVVMELLKSLESSKVDQVWVTTRPCFKEELENVFDTHAYNLEPFSKDDQKKFLKLFWNDPNDSRIEQFLNRFSNAINDPKGDFTSNPLQLKMAAELSDEMFFTKRMNLLMIYEKFFKEKFYRKLNVSSSLEKCKIDKAYAFDKLEHERLGLFALFDDVELSIIYSAEEMSEAKKSIKKFEDGTEKSEIIQYVVDGRPIFVHRTFAEYFAAIWLAGKLESDIGIFLRNIGFFEDSNITLRRFFDMAVANDSTRAVLDNAVDDIPSSMLDATDRGGRTALHLASSYRCQDMIDVLVKRGASVTSVDLIFKWTPIMYMGLGGDQRVFSALIEAGADSKISREPANPKMVLIEFSVNEHFNKILAGDMQQMSNKNYNKFTIFQQKIVENWTELHDASGRNDSEALQYLLKKGIKVDIKTKLGTTPLHVAALFGNEDVAQILMISGADVNARCRHELSPLHVACYRRFYSMVKLLISREADVFARDATGETPLHMAIDMGFRDVACLLIDSGADINAKNDIGLTPLHVASAYGHLNVAQKLLSGGASIDEKDTRGHTALILAAKYGSVSVTNHLIRQGADVNARDENGISPLHDLCGVYYGSSVELLIRAGAEVNAKSDLGATPLHFAAKHGNSKMAKRLIDNGGDINAKTDDNKTPIDLACQYGHYQTMKLLLENGAKVDSMMPLHFAIVQGHIEIVHELLRNGSRRFINARGVNGITALNQAIRKEHFDIVCILIENGADVNMKYDFETTSLHRAAAKGNLKIFKYLVENGSDLSAKANCISGLPLFSDDFLISMHTWRDITPLHQAAASANVEIVKYLISKGCEVDVKAVYDLTPLHLAILWERDLVVEQLIKSGSNVNAKAGCNFTPFNFAVLCRNEKIMKCLIDNGCDRRA